jgi:ketosteroid isomerase-like protein
MPFTGIVGCFHQHNFVDCWQEGLVVKPIVVIAVALWLAAGVTRGQTSSSDDGAHVLALDNSWNRALETNDTKALDMLLADTFVSIDIDGSMQTKPEFLTSLKTAGYQAPSQAVTEKSKVDVYGGSAVVVGIFRTQGKEKGRSVTRRERFLDTWVNLNGTWKCVASVAVLLPAQ